MIDEKPTMGKALFQIESEESLHTHTGEFENKQSDSISESNSNSNSNSNSITQHPEHRKNASEIPLTTTGIDSTTSSITSKKKPFNLLSQMSSEIDAKYGVNALWLFSSENVFRKKIQFILSLKIYSYGMHAIILINSLFLILETVKSLTMICTYSNIIFTVIFFIEFLMKIVAYGFILDEHTYLRDPWNWLDFIVVITGLMSFLPGINANLLALRTFRLIRPLKTIHVLPNMRLFISTLIGSLVDLATVFLLMLFFFVIFAILGLSLWAERFHYRCRTATKPVNGSLPIDPLYENYLCGDQITCGGHKEMCLNSFKFYPKEIKLKTIEDEEKIEALNYGLSNYNNIFQSLFVVFSTSTSEGWSNVMNMMMDGYNYYVSLIYFVLCVIINYYFMLNLTVAVLLFNFEQANNNDITRMNITKKKEKRMNRMNRLSRIGTSKHKKRALSSSSITNTSNTSFDTVDLIADWRGSNEDVNRRKYRLKYVPLKSVNAKAKDEGISGIKAFFVSLKMPKLFEKFPMTLNYHKKFKFGFYCYVVYKQPIVQMFFYFCIILNSIILMLDRVDVPASESHVLESINSILVCLFAFEMVLLIFGVGVVTFVKDVMNIFDCLIVLISLIELIVKQAKKNSSNSIASIFRMLRVFRIFKLFRKYQNFQIIMESILHTVKRMVDYLLVFIIFIYMYTLLGYSCFHDTISDKVFNFDSFISSFVSVFHIIIGDHWYDVFFSTQLSEKANIVVSYLYFITLIFLGHITMLNIFLAYLINNFQHAKQHSEKNLTVKNYASTLMYYCCRAHEMQLKQINKKTSKHKRKDVNTGTNVYTYNGIKMLDKCLQTMLNKQLLYEGYFALNGRIKVDFFQFKVVDTDKTNYFSNYYSNDPNSLMPTNTAAIAKTSYYGMNNIKVVVYDNHFQSRKTMNKTMGMFNYEIEDEKERSLYEIECWDFGLNYNKPFPKNLKSKRSVLDFEKLGIKFNGSESNRSDRKFNSNKLPTSPGMNRIAKMLEKKYKLKRKGLNLERKRRSSGTVCNVHKLFDNNINSNNASDIDGVSDISIGIDTLKPFENDVYSCNEEGNVSETEIEYYTNLITNGNTNTNSHSHNTNCNSSSIKSSASNNESEHIGHSSSSISDDEHSSQSKDSNSIHEKINNARKHSLMYTKTTFALDKTRTKSVRGTTSERHKHHPTHSSKSNSNSVTTSVSSSNYSDDSEDTNSQMTSHHKKRFIDKLRPIWNYMKKSSLFIFHKDSKVRAICSMVVHSRIFNYIIFLMIIGNCIMMCFDNPWLDPDSKGSKVISVFNIFFNIVFMIEGLLKVISNDFIYKEKEVINDLSKLKNVMKVHHRNINKSTSSSMGTLSTNSQSGTASLNSSFGNVSLSKLNIEEREHLIQRAQNYLNKRKAYLLEVPNVIDFVCILISIVDMSVTQNLRYIRVLRVFRAIRPIKLLVRSENLNIMIKSLFGSLPAVGNVLIVSGLFIIIFALFGVNIFKTTLQYYCTDMSIKNKETCIKKGFHWYRNIHNFTNFLHSLKTVFELILADGWGQMMADAGQRIGGDRWVYWFYFLIVIVGNMFILNLLISVIIQRFYIIKEKEKTNQRLTAPEKEWIHLQKVMLKFKPRQIIPAFSSGQKSKMKVKMTMFVKSRLFDNVILILIFLSLITLLIQYHNASDTYNFVLECINYVFTILFNIEIALKLYVSGKRFFYLDWNIFDLIIIAVCDIMAIVSIFQHLHLIPIKSLSALPIVFRSFRMLRILRLISALPKLRALIDSLAYLIPSVAGIGILMLLVILIYANIGMNIFGTAPYRNRVNHNINFRDFVASVALLFEVTTKENWNDIMYELAYHDCRNTSSEEYNEDEFCFKYNITCYEEKYVNYTSMTKHGMFSCGNDLSYLFFISYIIIGPLFIMNLCIVMVIEGYSESLGENEGLITSDYTERFMNVWLNYDTECRRIVKPYEFVLILKEMQPPVGLNYDRYIDRPNIDRELKYKKLIAHRKVIDLIQEKHANADNSGLVGNWKECGCTCSESSYAFEEYYLSKDKKFSTNDTEVMVIIDRLELGGTTLKKQKSFWNKMTNHMKKMAGNKDEEEEEEEEEENDDGDNNDNEEGGESSSQQTKEHFTNKKDFYIHYADACIGLSRFAVSKMSNISFDRLRLNVVNSYMKKHWIRRYKKDKQLYNNVYLESKKRKEGMKLSIHLATYLLYKKLLLKRLNAVKERISKRARLRLEEEEAKEQQKMLDDIGSIISEYDKEVLVPAEHKMSSMMNESDNVYDKEDLQEMMFNRKKRSGGGIGVFFTKRNYSNEHDMAFKKNTHRNEEDDDDDGNNNERFVNRVFKRQTNMLNEKYSIGDDNGGDSTKHLPQLSQFYLQSQDIKSDLFYQKKDLEQSFN